MMLTILESKDEIASAQNQFSQSLGNYAPESIAVSIGYQSGHFDTLVSWVASLGIWAYFGEPPKGKSGRSGRYWNVFGLGRPSGMVSIVCEINPPRQGIDRKIQGAFARTEAGKIAVLHRGRFNITGGMDMQYVRQHYPKSYANVADGRTSARVIVIGELGTPGFGNGLRMFINAVDRIKAKARSH